MATEDDSEVPGELINLPVAFFCALRLLLGIISVALILFVSIYVKIFFHYNLHSGLKLLPEGLETGSATGCHCIPFI